MNLNSRIATPEIIYDPNDASSLSSSHVKKEVPKKEFNKVKKV